jgi:[acyl-carrier-protein] S-malonyltransferase
MPMTLAFLFPGQGAQALGMGEDFLRAHPSVRQRLDQAGDGLGLDLRRVIAKGPARLLAETRIAQPAIFALSFAIGELLAARSLQCVLAAGHSLGEFTAVASAGALPFDTALALVIERGRLMHQVNESLDGGMLAVSGLAPELLPALVGQAGPGVWIANRNAPSQVALSGLRPALRRAHQLVTECGGRGTWFDVAGPYHTPLLADAAQAFAALVDAARMHPPRFPVIANGSAEPLGSAESVRQELAQQMLNPVDWTGTMRRIAASGNATLVEVGPGRVLKGLALRNNPELRCWSTGTVREFDAACRALENTACAVS